MLSQENRNALRRAHEAGIEIMLGTGRRHDFALPIAQSLGFELWMMSSNGAVTRSTAGETFHRDLLPKVTAIKLAQAMRQFLSGSKPAKLVPLHIFLRRLSVI